VNIIYEIIAALQFLTRLNISQRLVLPETLGRSVRHFPLVGAVIGLVLAVVAQIPAEYIPVRVLAVVLLGLELVVTGGMHIDGLMDTFDGIFSGRSRERMLEIMKDSRVGAYGVMGFGLFILLKWSLLTEILPSPSFTGLFVMPVLGRLGIVIAITGFPYGRESGLGKVFSQHAGRGALYAAIIWTLIFTLPFGKIAVFCLIIAVGFAILFARYVCKVLGGLTGDVYGAVLELTEVVALLTFMLFHGCRGVL